MTTQLYSNRDSLCHAFGLTPPMEYRQRGAMISALCLLESSDGNAALARGELLQALAITSPTDKLGFAMIRAANWIDLGHLGRATDVLRQALSIYA